MLTRFKWKFVQMNRLELFTNIYFKILSSNCTFTQKNSRNKSSSTSRTIKGQHQFKLIINTHQLTNSRFHNVWEMGVESEHRTINGYNHILVIHFLEQSSEAGTYHETGSS